MPATIQFFVIRYPDDDTRVVFGNLKACASEILDNTDTPVAVYESEVGGLCVDRTEDAALEVMEVLLREEIRVRAGMQNFIDRELGVRAGFELQRMEARFA